MNNRLTPLEILTKLISFPTVSSQTNRPLIDWVQGYLAEHGIEAHQWVDPEQPHKAALFAHVGPWVEGAIVMSGHTDVVPIEGQDWDSDPWTVTEKGDKYFGRGTCDMKGFDALAVWAMVEGQYANLKTPLQIALSFDEEIGCTGAPPMIAAMNDVLPKGAMALVGEPSEMRVVTGQKGGMGFPTHMRGFEVHSSLAYQGVSAIHEAAKLIEWANQMNRAAAEAAPQGADALFDPPYTSWHVGMIEGGTAHNITAKDCHFTMGFRAVPGDDPEVLKAAYYAQVEALRAEMKAVRAEADITVDISFEVPPLRPEENGAAEAFFRALTGDNGTHVVSYGTEAGHFQAAGYSAVICGPGNIAQAHQPNEFITKVEFQRGHQFMRDLIKRLS